LLVGGGAPAAIDLSGTDAFDTGHAIFHSRGGARLACASCHPEGVDDGRPWQFARHGTRRTQQIRGGILDTAPFHWSGDMVTFEMLVDQVFVGRMGGTIDGPEEAAALGAWMDTLPALPRPPVADPGAVERGRALFMDPAIGCATCHAGENLTTNVSVDVGTGGVFQVPTLLGIAYRAPYLHDGCAATLRDRFTTCGGGDMHGHTSGLGPAQIDDLVAYLRTL
jgi:cytochrome c peroxidase